MDGDTELYFLSISGCGWGHLIIFCLPMIRKYHSHKTLRETLLKLESEFPDIAEVEISREERFSSCHCLSSRSPPLEQVFRAETYWC